MTPSLSQQVAQYHFPTGGALNLTHSRWNYETRDSSASQQRSRASNLPIRMDKHHFRSQSSIVLGVRSRKEERVKERHTCPKLIRRQEQYSESSCFTSRDRLDRPPFFAGATASGGSCFRFSSRVVRSRTLLASSSSARAIVSLSNVAFRFPLSSGFGNIGMDRGGEGGSGSERGTFGGDLGFVGESCGKGEVSPRAMAPRRVVDPGGGFGVREGAS